MPQEDTPGQMPPSGKSILVRWNSADGLTLAARIWPAIAGRQEKLPVLCLPGLSRNHRDFEALATELAGQGHRVVAMDYRGRGASDRDPNWQNYTMPVEAGDIDLGLIATGLSRFAVVGTSRGGIHAMLLAQRRPDSVAAVILNDIGPVIERKGLQRIARTLGERRIYPDWEAAAAALEIANRDQFTALDAFGWQRFARQIHIATDAGVVPDCDPLLTKPMQAEESEENPSLWPLFNSLEKIPAMMLQGENSDILSRDTVLAAVQRKPDLVAVTVENEGHAPLLWDMASQQAILRFLAGRTW